MVFFFFCTSLGHSSPFSSRPEDVGHGGIPSRPREGFGIFKPKDFSLRRTGCDHDFCVGKKLHMLPHTITTKRRSKMKNIGPGHSTVFLIAKGFAITSVYQRGVTGRKITRRFPYCDDDENEGRNLVVPSFVILTTCPSSLLSLCLGALNKRGMCRQARI